MTVQGNGMVDDGFEDTADRRDRMDNDGCEDTGPRDGMDNGGREDSRLRGDGMVNNG